MIAPGVPGALGLVGADPRPAGRFVYFAERDGRIKIGCSRQPNVRMRSLGTRLLGVLVGGFWLERAYHRHFAADALGHEWFTPSPALLAFIAHLPADAEAAENAYGSGRRQRPEHTSPAEPPNIPPADLLDHHAAFLFAQHRERVAS